MWAEFIFFHGHTLFNEFYMALPGKYCDRAFVSALYPCIKDHFRLFKKTAGIFQRGH